MPYLQRNHRMLLRFFFAVVLAMALFGGWYADRNWRPEPEDLQVPTLSGQEDWIELIAGLAEDAIQVVQGITSR